MNNYPWAHCARLWAVSRSPEILSSRARANCWACCNSSSKLCNFQVSFIKINLSNIYTLLTSNILYNNMQWLHFAGQCYGCVVPCWYCWPFPGVHLCLLQYVAGPDTGSDTYPTHYSCHLPETNTTLKTPQQPLSLISATNLCLTITNKTTGKNMLPFLLNFNEKRPLSWQILVRCFGENTEMGNKTRIRIHIWGSRRSNISNWYIESGIQSAASSVNGAIYNNHNYNYLLSINPSLISMSKFFTFQLQHQLVNFLSPSV